MECIINTRCDIMRNMLDEHEVFQWCGVDPFADIHNTACDMERDLKALTLTAWGRAFNQKYNGMRILVALMKRRAVLGDVAGLYWCIDKLLADNQKSYGANIYKAFYPSW